MKAKVQYNDFLGTSAADFSDDLHLEDYLKSKGVDTDKYYPIGVEFYSGYSSSFQVRFICREKGVVGKAIKIGFEQEVSKTEFFNLFKRMNVILTFGNEYSDWDLDDDPIMIDNRV